MSTISIEEAKKIRKQFRVLALIALLTLAVGTLAMMILEDLSIIDGFYFSIVALTTVGFGDITPVTSAGKLFVSFYLLVGIAIVAAFINNVLRSAVARKVINDTNKKK